MSGPPPPGMPMGSGPHGEPTEAETEALVAKVLKAPKFQPILHKAYAIGGIQLVNFAIVEGVMIFSAVAGKFVTWLIVVDSLICALFAIGTIFTWGYVHDIRELEDPYELTNAMTRLTVSNVVATCLMFYVGGKIISKSSPEEFICGHDRITDVACTSNIPFLMYGPLLAGVIVLLCVVPQVWLGVKIYKDPIMNPPKDDPKNPPPKPSAMPMAGGAVGTEKDPFSDDEDEDSEKEQLMKGKVSSNHDPEKGPLELGRRRSEKRGRRARRR